MIVLAPISIGELIDKITILEIKELNVKTPEQREHVEFELRKLTEILEGLALDVDLSELRNKLKAVNQALWYIEDYKRECERSDDFGAGFITAARQVYIKNDQRATIKREINSRCNSDIVEVKLY
jgi:hypothetical protein